jgi:hypothetical protein
MPQHKKLTRQLAAIGTLALATTAWAEAPMATDDAGTLEKGGTKVEGQWSREGQTRGLGLAVAHSPFEKLEAEISFARSTDRSGSPHVSNRITGLALKWVPISIGKTHIGVKVDRSTEKPDNANRARSSSIRGLYTLRMDSGHAFHMNLGRSRQHRPQRLARVRAQRTTPSGVPAATMRPPALPPSGPRSMTQSASAITSRSCSITTTLWPPSTRRCSTRMSFSTSAMCRPTVGSSSTYRVCGAFWPRRPMSSRTLVSSVTSLMRWASPPLSVGEGWPSVR